jgi:hypothetical protein
MMINELEKVWKKENVAQFKVLSQNMPEGIEENHGKPNSG